jgi:ribonuclease HII
VSAPSVSRIGVDEAGLGPTLGPLVVGSFTTRNWPDPITNVLADAIRSPGPARDSARIEVGDSKAIHTGPHKLARLEHTVLATLAWIHGAIPKNAAALLELVCLAPDRRTDRGAPWYEDLAETLPVAADPTAIETSAALLATLSDRAGVARPEYHADLYPVRRINRELRDELLHPGGSKNTWATAAVLRSVRHSLRPGDHALCDKAGGRRAYVEPIRRAFPGCAVEMRLEEREQSHYTLDLPDAPAHIGFLMKGDSRDLHIAWASCMAKYVRELVMRAFNRHFLARRPELRPTAGYPEDARRFIDDVRSHALDGDLGTFDWIRDR